MGEAGSGSWCDVIFVFVCMCVWAVFVRGYGCYCIQESQFVGLIIDKKIYIYLLFIIIQGRECGCYV